MVLEVLEVQHSLGGLVNPATKRRKITLIRVTYQSSLGPTESNSQSLDLSRNLDIPMIRKDCSHETHEFLKIASYWLLVQKALCQQPVSVWWGAELRDTYPDAGTGISYISL